MKYAICILAHKDPVLLERIVNKVSCPNTKIYIHLDKKCNINEFSNISSAVFIKKRVKVSWGGRSIIIAMKNLMKYVIQDNECDYLLFISGQDYPIVMPYQYDEMININYNYFEYEPLPRAKWYKGGLERINFYYFFEKYNHCIGNLLIKIQRRFRFTRNMLNKIRVYGGSQWLNINISTAKYIIESWRYYYKFFKFSLIPDEMIFQTIVMNSIYSVNVINNNLRYIVFNGDEPSPRMLDVTDYEEIKKESKLFCRKVISDDLLDIIDFGHRI